MFRDHGQARKYHHAVVGWNARMDGIQGEVLRIKLKNLAEKNRLRRTHAEAYDRQLAGVGGLKLPHKAEYGTHVYHLYVVRVGNRESFMQQLHARGIGCAIHYPVPIHLQQAYTSLGLKRGSFPITERCSDEIVSLPMFPELTSEQVSSVCEAVKASVAA